MKFSTLLITTMGLSMNTAYAKKLNCYNNDWSIIATDSPNILATAEDFCHAHEGETVEKHFGISTSAGFPNGDGSGEPFKVTLSIGNDGKEPQKLEAGECIDLFSQLVGGCLAELNLEDKRLFKGGILADEARKEGLRAVIDKE